MFEATLLPFAHPYLILYQGLLQQRSMGSEASERLAVDSDTPGTDDPEANQAYKNV